MFFFRKLWSHCATRQETARSSLIHGYCKRSLVTEDCVGRFEATHETMHSTAPQVASKNVDSCGWPLPNQYCTNSFGRNIGNSTTWTRGCVAGVDGVTGDTVLHGQSNPISCEVSGDLFGPRSGDMGTTCLFHPWKAASQPTDPEFFVIRGETQ